MRVLTAVATLCLVLAAAVLSVSAQQQNLMGQKPLLRDRTRDVDVKIETVPASVALIRDVSGDYSQHVRVFTQLMEYAPRFARLAGMAAGGDCFGIYPMDPDTVINPANLKWQVGVGMTQAGPGDDGDGLLQPPLPRLPTRKPAAPYRMTRLPAVKVATIMSDVKYSEFDGMTVERWMLENGYVQNAPTRMVYLAHTGDPHDIPVRIMIPVVERASGVKLPK